MAISSAGLIGAAVGVSLGSTVLGATLAAFFIVLAFKRLIARQPIKPTTDEVIAEALFNIKPIRPLKHDALNRRFAVGHGIYAGDDSLVSAGCMSYFIDNWVMSYLKCEHDELPDIDYTVLTSITGFDCDWRALLLSKFHKYHYGHYALCMIVARFLTARMIIDGDPATTFLPPTLLEVYQEIMAERKKEMPRMYLGHTVPWDLPYVWRVLSIHVLLTNRYSCHQHTGYWAPSEVKADDPRIPRINAAAEELWSVLKPFYRVTPVTPDDTHSEEAALEHLKSLFFRMAMIATSYFAMIEPVEMYWVDDMPEGAFFQVYPAIRRLEMGEYNGREGMYEFMRPGTIMQHPEFAVTNGELATHREELKAT